MKNEDVLNNIKNMITTVFPSLNVQAYYHDIYNELNISISNRDIYYSESYQELITQINIDYLWPKGIINVLFILGYDDFILSKEYKLSSIDSIKFFTKEKINTNYSDYAFKSFDDKIINNNTLIQNTTNDILKAA